MPTIVSTAPATPGHPRPVALRVEEARPEVAGPRRIEELPREVGVMLMSVGVLGFVLPGVAGTPAILAGGLVLWPKTFGKVERWLQRRYPVAHREGMRQVGRYLDDLERRFPDSTRT